MLNLFAFFGRHASYKVIKSLAPLLLLLPLLIILYIPDLLMIKYFEEWFLFSSYAITSVQEGLWSFLRYFLGFLMGTSLVSAYVYMIIREESSLGDERWALVFMLSGIIVVSLKFIPFPFTFLNLVNHSYSALLERLSQGLISTFYYLPAIFVILSARVEDEEFELSDVTPGELMKTVYIQAWFKILDNFAFYLKGAGYSAIYLILVVALTFFLDYLGAERIVNFLITVL